MKISDLNQRAQAFYEDWREENDGDFTKNLERGGWVWAKITPISPSVNFLENKSGAQGNRYEVSMHKNHISNTRNACLRQLGWNHKLLEIYTPWLEKRNISYVKSLARECNEGEHNG